MRSLAFLLAAVGFRAAALAQQPAPTPDTTRLQFNLRVAGSGSDPDRNAATVGARSRQNWRLERTVSGWAEATTRRSQVGQGAKATQVIEFRVDRDAAMQITAELRDQVRNELREIGEGGSYFDYEAEEAWTASWSPRFLENLLLRFDVATQTWETAFLPVWLCDNPEITPLYEGSARYRPWDGGGFGEPWNYFADSEERRTEPDGERYIETRYRSRYVPPASLVPGRVKGSVDGATIRGEFRGPVRAPREVSGTWKMECTCTWSIEADLADVELEVRARNYDTWLPEATLASRDAQRGAGPVLYLLAEVRSRDSRRKAPLPKIETIVWRLVDTSREPGIAMNYPWRTEDRRPDLGLVAGDLTPPDDPEAQTLTLRPGDVRSEIVVEPFDYGGWATLRVEAKLDDGRRLQGILRGAPGVNGPISDIPIPARPPGSKIALAWLRRNCPDWTDDFVDADAVPAGKPGADGDGFTLYQEYRGFFCNFRHLRTDPRHKDLFVLSDGYPRLATAATKRFAQLSGLTVHPDTSPLFAGPTDRRINRNVGAGPHTAAQGAIFVREVDTADRQNDRIPAGSRPGTGPALEVPSAVDFLPQTMVNVDGTMASEVGNAAVQHTQLQALFQLCGVDRPGPSDSLEQIEWSPGDPSLGVPPYFLANGRRVRLESATGADLAIATLEYENADAAGRARLVRERGQPVGEGYYCIGRKGGAHSGPEECVMRDWFADFYVTSYQRDGMPVYRPAAGQKPGRVLGVTRAGTGINAAGKLPEPWFGDSAVAVPARQQLVVRDNAP